jgi:hypothetical protein
LLPLQVGRAVALQRPRVTSTRRTRACPAASSPRGASPCRRT